MLGCLPGSLQGLCGIPRQTGQVGEGVLSFRPQFCLFLADSDMDGTRFLSALWTHLPTAFSMAPSDKAAAVVTGDPCTWAGSSLLQL